MKELLKSYYQFSDYQIAQLVYLFKTLTSEISKILLIGLFFRNEIPFYIICMIILGLLRMSTGGLHCKTYLSCLVASCFYIVFTFRVLPMIPARQPIAVSLLLLCMAVIFKIGPVTSDVHMQLSESSRDKGKLCTLITIAVFTVFMCIHPENRYVTTGFWIILSHTLQLCAAKIRKIKKGVIS